jgi:hypothetical protein
MKLGEVGLYTDVIGLPEMLGFSIHLTPDIIAFFGNCI